MVRVGSNHLCVFCHTWHMECKSDKYYGIELDQWFSTKWDFTLHGSFSNTWKHFGCYDGWHCAFRGMPGMLLNILQQKSVCSKITIVLRLRNDEIWLHAGVTRWLSKALISGPLIRGYLPQGSGPNILYLGFRAVISMKSSISIFPCFSASALYYFGPDTILL